jgi:3-hydroxyacyl-CoA dehydrogenase/enoyl-CoA hydratase/3-hydroxybutyryl-CoA epimerase
MRLTDADAPALFAEIERLKRAFRTLETLGIPVVACLNGSALGGGWEVALSAPPHRRRRRQDPVRPARATLGLIPGATGITKMTRLLGLMGAQPFIMESKLFNPRQGTSWAWCMSWWRMRA